ncbi:class I SAM-dependent methyltransferase [Methylobacterium gnaphalii]|uniref:Methyltransferase n=1 Tax=Methylobacterium gnaphalii TaxID=1010610 RepID=A0A512JJ94_9HYPH|nr:methyltransferase domain-containing protein [Methylobacterium gnaphalii]GEP10027.1 methyltransferase [Methylobacterium gnaphalii]GJD69021.1 2-methoxy-6-polyprenyl-1,4-benzoquinol methylase, mitochondrial [Methylobacterium gnaphalii]GLS48297.1 methyltransferase [Methylobacterium gnaphalii]
MTEANRDQAEYWNGDVGQRWAASHSTLDAVFAPLTEALFMQAGLRPGNGVLDIGCGAGQTALHAARQVGASGRVVAADLSKPLLTVGRQRAAAEPATTAPIEWIEADAQSNDFGQGTFEHALSRFGVMFFDDSVTAFANICRALAPGGRLTFLCWRALAENPWVQVPRDVVLPLVPDYEAMPTDAPGPFRFADPRTLSPLLGQAGFQDIACEPIDRLLTLSRSVDGPARGAVQAATDIVINLGPVARLLRDRDPALRERAREIVADTLEARVHDGAVRLGAACWLVSARR